MSDPKLTREEERQLEAEVTAALEAAREKKEQAEIDECLECREMFK